MSEQNRPDPPGEANAKKRKWKPMTLTDLGDLSEVVQGGGGKLTIVGSDPGESRKPQGQG